MPTAAFTSKVRSLAIFDSIHFYLLISRFIRRPADSRNGEKALISVYHLRTRIFNSEDIALFF
jgi:hypothetical protein